MSNRPEYFYNIIRSKDTMNFFTLLSDLLPLRNERYGLYRLGLYCKLKKAVFL